MPTLKRLRQIGTSAGVILPKVLLDQLGWRIGTPVTIAAKNGALVLAKAVAQKAQAA